MQKVLIIGSSQSYDLIDVFFLSNFNLKPFFLYLENQRGKFQDDKNVYVKSLTISDVKRCAKINKFDGIICLNDNFLMQTAKIREELEISGINSVQMQKYKLKSVMYDELKNKLATIPYHWFKKDLSYRDLCFEFGSPPFCIKPNNLAGSEGVCIINNEKEYKHLISSKLVPSIEYIIQPYINGELYHCELVVSDGRILYKQARTYSYPNLSILSGKIIASFPIFDAKLEKKIEEQAEIVQNGLNFKNGVMHTEFFKDEQEELRFLETNIRPAGGGINFIHKKRIGISLETLMILLEMERKVDITTIDNKILTSGYIPMREGKVLGINFPKLKGEVTYIPKVKVGDMCHRPKSASDASLSYIAEYTNPQDMFEDFSILESSDPVIYESKR